MGYLHEGHASLIRKSSLNNDKTVVSVFLNPLQFGLNEDLEIYPKDIERDKKIFEKSGGNIIFNPEYEEMYSNEFSTFIDMTLLTQELCGLSRLTHFI